MKSHTVQGSAAVEFAVTAPILMLALAGIADFGLALRSQIALANGVANASYYAFLKGKTADPTALAKTLGGIIQKSSGLPSATSQVSGPFCGCPSGTPIVVAGKPCAQTCTDGSSPGSYVAISATYAYAPIMPGLALAANTQLTETATVRVP